MSQLTISAQLSLRSGFAMIHLRAAIRDALNAHSVEQNNDTSQFGSWFDDMMAYVPVVIISAAAALEASSNELIQDVLDGSTQYQLSEGNRLLLEELTKDRSGKAMVKFKKLGWRLNRVSRTDSAAWQNAGLLFKFRNSFMHFKPAWDSDTDVHDSALVRDLKQRVPVVLAYQQNFMFPYGFLNYGCAKWAVESARSFSSEFCTPIALKDRLSEGLTLP
jgi:hypothetical protein